MALVNGTNYDHIDLHAASGGDVTRHKLQDSEARAMIGPTEASSTASAAHPAGSYFIYNNKLYQATSDIASGGTITPNTNCKEAPLGASVSDLKSALMYSNEGNEIFSSYAEFVNGTQENGVYNHWYIFRVTSETIFSFDRDLLVTVKPGYRFFLALYVNGSWTQNTSWVADTSYRIAKGTSFKIVIGKVTEETSVTANISEFVQAVTFTTESNLKHCAKLIAGAGKYVDYNYDSKLIKIPTDTVLINYDAAQSYLAFSSALTLTHTVNSNALKLYIDTQTPSIIEADYSEWRYDINDRYAFIGCLHINGANSTFTGSFAWSINDAPYGIPDENYNAKLAVIIPSVYGDITVNTISKTITIPYDTIVLKSAATPYIILTDQTVDYSSVQSSAIIIYLNLETGVFRPTHYGIGAEKNEVIFCIIRDGTPPVKVCMNGPFYVDTKPLGIIDVDKAALNPEFRSINHRGWNSTAPENTLPAFKQSKLHGFDYVETDVQFTNDNVAVLLHDTTINRTARNDDGTEISGDIRINYITYEQAMAYDFGIWKGAAYAGTRIPTFAEFVALCKRIGLKSYVELKYASGASQSNIQSLVDIAEQYDMLQNIVFISFSDELLGYIRARSADAKIALLCNTVTATEITTATSLGAFIDSGSSTSDEVALCRNAGVRLERWTINQTSTLYALDPYISGATSDTLVCGYELFSHYSA